MKTAFLCTFLFAAAAHADGITLAGTDTEATIALPGIHAINPAVRTVGDRLEIDVADESPAQATTFKDATVAKVEVVGGAHAHIAVQIKHSTKTTEILGKAARVEETAEGVTIRVPRDAKAAAAMAAEAPSPKPSPSPIPSPIPSPSPIAIPIPIAVVAPKPAPQPIALAESPRLPTGTLVALGGIAVAAIVIHMARKKRAAKAPEAKQRSIDIVSSRSLGGKTRIVLISVADQELLLSVTDAGGAKLLQSWQKEEEEADDDDWRAATASAPPMPRPVGIAPPRALPQAPAPAARGTVDLGTARAPSPAVSGILKLKLGSGSAPHPSADLDEDEGDPNRDAAWVQELVKAARRKGDAA